MRALPLLALLLGLLAVSTAGPYILLSDIPAFSIAAWRLLAVAGILLPFSAVSLVRGVRGLNRRERLWLGLSGVFYGLHFALFAVAFDYTSKESVVVILGGQPLVAAALGFLLLRERVARGTLAGIAVALCGLVIFVWNDYRFDAAHLVGDALVIAASVAIVLSYIAGRRLRPRMGLMGYLAALYLLGGLTCLAAALLAGDALWGYTDESWFFVACAILIPTLIGHSLFHYVVKYLPVVYVNLAILGEPVIALAIMFGLAGRYEIFRQTQLGLPQVAGGALLLLGAAAGILSGARMATPRTTGAAEERRDDPDEERETTTCKPRQGRA